MNDGKDDKVVNLRLPSFGQQGLYTLANLPLRPSIEQEAIGTGWPEMDQILKLYPGQFIVTTGIAGSGKSTFWLNIVCNLAHQHGMHSFLYVPENERYIQHKLRRIWANRGNGAWDYFSNTQCYVQSAQPEHYGSDPQTIDWVCDRAATAVRKGGVKLLLLDPWNEIERAKPKDMLLTDYIGMCLTWIKQFCRAFEVIVVLIAHPTKDGIKEGKTPKLSDIEGSMNWYNKADNGLILVRDMTTTKVISAKVRERGAGELGACLFAVDNNEVFTPIQVERQ